MLMLTARQFDRLTVMVNDSLLDGRRGSLFQHGGAVYHVGLWCHDQKLFATDASDAVRGLA